LIKPPRRQERQEKRVKSKSNRKGAEGRKGKQKQNESKNSEILCGFSLRLRAFAVIAFLCVPSATSAPLRLSPLFLSLLAPWR
jgi:hypothetical protein